jgi:hypothetical protein
MEKHVDFDETKNEEFIPPPAPVVVENFQPEPPNNDFMMAIIAGVLAVGVYSPMVQNHLNNIIPMKPMTYAASILIVAVLFLAAKKFVN